MDQADFVVFAMLAKQAQEAERVATSFALQRQALMAEYAENPIVLAALWRLDASEEHARALAKELKTGAGRGKARRPGLVEYCTDQRMKDHVGSALGLGDAVYYFLGLLPQWVAEFQTVSKLWAYCGLHVVDGAAPRRQKGKKSNWSAELKAIAIKRLAEPCMKNLRSPYRAVYDARRAHTDGTHPEWPDWHRHKDAMRVTAKQIVKDLWRVSRGHEALFGGLNLDARDTLFRIEQATDLLIEPNLERTDTLERRDGLTLIDGNLRVRDTLTEPEAVNHMGAA